MVRLNGERDIYFRFYFVKVECTGSSVLMIDSCNSTPAPNIHLHERNRIPMYELLM